MILEPRPTAGERHRWTSSCLPRPGHAIRPSRPRHAFRRRRVNKPKSPHSEKARSLYASYTHIASSEHQCTLHTLSLSESSPASGMPSSQTPRHARRALRTPQRMLHAQRVASPRTTPMLGARASCRTPSSRSTRHARRVLMQRYDQSRTDLAPPHGLAASLALRRRHARLRRTRFDEAPSSVADGTDASHCAPALDIIRTAASRTAASHFSNNMHTAMHNTSIRALSKRRTKAERSCERTTQG